MNAKERIEAFIRERKIKRNRFVGRCIVTDKGNQIIGDIISVDEHIQLVKSNGDRLTINAASSSFEFIDGKSYEFSIYIPVLGANGYIVVVLDFQFNPPNLSELNSREIILNQKREQHNKLALQNFLERSNIKENRFYGICIETESGYKIVSDIISKNEGFIVLRQDGDRLSISVGNSEFEYIPNCYYEFSIKVSIRGVNKDEVVAFDHSYNLPLILEFNPYKEITRLRYERLDNPEANRMIAHLMREIGKGLYSSKQRMIFELLQNADDTPAGDVVSFHIDAYYDYFLVMHNGVPFNQDDVEAITSAAESTKRNDKKKTGYKGIGFKSVFTDSEEVIIKSGGFLFTFKRNHLAYNNFDSFYFSKKRYKDYPALLDEDKLKYAKQRKTFNGNTDIPWQLIPIWLEELPKTLNDSRLATYNNNVGFAIKFGKEKVKEYLDAVSYFVEKPHFMLFLRHVNLFKSFKNGVTVRKSGEAFVTIEKTTLSSDDLKLHYFKQSFDTIEVNDTALSEEGIRIFKKEKTNEYGEVSHYFSSDEEGNKVIESIPPKLAAFDTTSITFAAPVNEGKISCEPSYLDGKTFSCFFTYLPMKEIRIQLPFLINADFVPSSNREDLQGDNQWNEYIISKIAYYHLRWLKMIAEQSIDKGRFEPEYLSLLLKNSLDEDSSIQLLIDKYNSVYFQSLIGVEFIISDKITLIKTSETILDMTGISDLIGTDFFYKLTSTDKHLPHPLINSSYLNYQYLQIDKYASSSLVADLGDEVNRTLLSEELKNLDSTKYLSFLKWLNEFCQFNVDDSDWVLSLPFIHCSEGILPLKEIIASSKFIIKSQKTKKIEHLLLKMGYELSAFYIDDYKHLFEKIWHIDSYLTKDLKLYECISSSNKVGLLNPSEKALLITFIKSLTGIGETRYADVLSLFKSKGINEKLKPLSSLISNTCTHIPSWLSTFVINELEEAELSIDFKKHLITESNLLELFFCNPGLFEEFASHIDEEKIESFYSYILNLKNSLPVDKVLTYTGIPWIYVPSLKCFQLPAEVYCPDSLLKLSTEKYASVKAVIESVSTEKLPIFSALSIIESFALGFKKVSVSSIFSVAATVEMFKANDFLDWSASNGEKDLLRLLSIEKRDSHFVISKSPGQIHYYTNNKELVASIEAHSNLNSKLLLFPSELHSPERHKIGLMEDGPLIKYLLENGIASLSFIKFIYPLKDEAIKNLFIEKLPVIDLLSTQKYDKESEEHKMLDMIIDLGKEDDKYYESVISKFTIDGHGLSKKNISDDVIFKFPAKENSPERRYVLKLSKILPTYEDDTAALTTVIGNFIDIKNVNTLRKVFKTAPKKTDEIFNEIHSLQSEYLTPSQMFFLLLFQEGREKLDIRKGKLDFDEYWFEKDKKQYEDLSIEFLNILFKEGYFKFQDKFSFNDLVPSNKITNEIYAVEEEKLPTWVLSWLNDEAKAAKIGFLVSAGLNNDDSSIVSLRKGIIDNNKDLFEKGLANTDNTVLLGNTAIWLHNYQNAKKVSFTKIFLKPLYLKFESKKLSIIALPLPTMQGVSLLSYQLILKSDRSLFHSVNETWGTFSTKIFNSIVSSGAFVIDDVLPPSVHKLLNSIEGKPAIEADASQLSSNSKLFNEPYYSDWPQKAKYQIFIYDGLQLPYLIKYQTLFSETIAEGKSAIVNNIFYVTIDDKDDLPFPLKGILPENIYLDLVKTKSEYDRKKNREQYEISYSDEESKAINRLFGDEIPRGFHKDLNLASLIKGLIYLSNNGYDISEAEDALRTTHEYSQLYPVYANGVEKDLSNALKVKCRSAKSGLLYLRASSWQELEKENIYMYVLTGKDNTDCRFCTTREAVIEDAKADYRVLRIEANNGVSDIDDIIQGKFDPENLWLIIRMADKKEYKSIFEKIRENEANDTINNANMGDESHD